ncbi:unnamed protein product, partial [marine sediment metagenome]
RKTIPGVIPPEGIGSGGGIHAHPDGPVAGATAFRQAIDIGMRDMKDASEDFEDYV